MEEGLDSCKFTYNARITNLVAMKSHKVAEPLTVLMTLALLPINHRSCTGDSMVTTTLTFIRPLPLYDTEKPYFLKLPGTDTSQSFHKTNLEYFTRDGVVIGDAREQGLNTFSLEDNGFQFLNYETRSSLDEKNADIEAYCREITELVSRKYNAARVICYDYRVGVPQQFYVAEIVTYCFTRLS